MIGQEEEARVYDEMARNRKNQSAAIRFGPALKALLLCLLIGGSGVGYVWQKDQIFQLGQQIRKRELRLADLENQSEKLRNQLAMMRSPRFLERRIQELNLGLVPPQPNADLAVDRAGARVPGQEPDGNTPRRASTDDRAEGLDEEFCRRP